MTNKLLIFIVSMLIFDIKQVQTAQVSYNQPKFNACVSWNPNGTTIVTLPNYSQRFSGLFINTNNTIFSIVYETGFVFIWDGINYTSIANITTNRSEPNSLFVTNKGVIHVPDGKTSLIDHWVNSTYQMYSINMSQFYCHSVFVDLNETMYCSRPDGHDVIVKTIPISNNQFSPFVGRTCSGDAPDQLTYPKGIFVDKNFTLYVADGGNHRIQRFYYGEKNGTTVAGYRAVQSFPLYSPTSVILDADDYLFIVDSKNHRIVRSGPNGFHCILGCTRKNGWKSYQFSEPLMISFDVEGNIFVTDSYNYRIQKFSLINGSCPTTNYTQTMTTNNQSTTNTTPSSLSYNQPTFSSCATWNSSGAYWVNQGYERGLFVDRNNTVFYGGSYGQPILMWEQSDQARMKNFSTVDTTVFSLFVTSIGAMIADQGYDNIVQRIYSNGTKETVAQMRGSCYGLFVDIYNTIYCSLRWLNQVVMKTPSSDIEDVSVVAGNGCFGSSSYELAGPYGIFVDQNLTLYVADFFNDRIQRFSHRVRNGTTFVGRIGIHNYSLSYPTSVILDGEGNLFIAEKYNKRIVRQTANGFQCIIGCSTSSSTLDWPTMLAFDSNGNLFIANDLGARLQKFFLLTNSCDSTMTTSESTPQKFWQNYLIEYIDLNATCTSTLSTLSESSHTTLRTDAVTTTEHPTTVMSQIEFVSSTSTQCNNASLLIGPSLYINSSACAVLNPCLHDGTCVNNGTLPQGYQCFCASGFNGSQCDIDQRRCQSMTCRNGGTCINDTSSHSLCQCVVGWTGQFCETMINKCRDVTCQNNGVCRPLVDDYQCECLSSSYSGRHCEILSSSLTVRKKVSQSIGYVALISIALTIGFFVSMDVLKYVFHIDPIQKERRQFRDEKAQKKSLQRSTRPPKIIHHVYINKT